VVVETHDSHVLRGNPLRDPTRRDIAIYLPPKYDPRRAYPAAYAIVGYTGTGRSLLNVDPLGEDLKAKLDRLIRTGRMGPMIVPMIDCFTRVGGNQYINSTATGRYDDYLHKEIIPFVEAKYRVSRRGIWGKSSGGFGSIVQGMLHPDRWAALADHSGDSCFELSYLFEFPKALAAFREHGGPKRWLAWFWRQPNRRRSEFFPALNQLGMAAHYSPNPRSPELGIDFPFDFETGEWRPDVWERWRRWDPVNMIDRHWRALKRLRLVYIDCGTKDEWNLIWGARALHAKLRRYGVKHVYEEFDDGHLNITFRYDTSLPALWRALRP
ncbi:MAG TPA: alpha/beta hydrolase-fold protein, partial [Thermoplasmata archaeon]|nr:alpha/beta hydrolase-fold protein [Thermoplasmata archaeon]